ncbi:MULTISPECIES: hypothetical protein [Virgibacillus]|nr:MULTISPECIES: hypothetical protein [Virgibacillus]
MIWLFLPTHLINAISNEVANSMSALTDLKINQISSVSNSLTIL